jgi:uncharacterized membrane protein
MEQKVRNLAVFVATLAMIASVLIVPSVSADSHDLQIAGSGDEGLSSYASQNGTAEFEISVTDMAGDNAHTNVAISVSFSESGWLDDQASITDCTDGTVPTSLAEGGTIAACISVDVQASDVEIGDTADMLVYVNSTEDSTGSSIALTIVVTNWFASSADGVKAYAEDDTNTYTITVTNILLDVTGTGQQLDTPIHITLANAGSGWNIDSADGIWDEMLLTAKINYLPANGSYDLVLDIQLIGEIIPASSYVGNSFIVFQVHDATVYTLVSLEASVADNFNVNVIGSGNEDVDNGCDTTTASVGWTPVIKNFGNTMDSFDVTFDKSGLPSGWTADGADASFNTGDLHPKYEHDGDGKGTYTANVGLHVPAGLAAGTSHGFTMTVTSLKNSSITQTQSFSATVVQCFDIALAGDAELKNANPGSTADFSLTVTNSGNGPDTISFSCMAVIDDEVGECNALWSPTFSVPSVTVASGASGQAVFSFTAPSDAASGDDSGVAMLHATSEDVTLSPSVSVKAVANQIYGLTAGYYSNETDVVKDSVSVQEGMSVQMKFTVTNNGNGNDEVTLSLVGAPTWVTLPDLDGDGVPDNALIGPGQKVNLTVDIAAPASDARGDHLFQVTATSADGTTTSTTGDLTVTVTEKVDSTGGPTTEELDEEEGGLPGFGALSAIAAIGAVLLIRRRL